MTYFLMSQTTPLQDISEFFETNEIVISSVSSLLFVTLLCWLFPLSKTRREDVICPKDLLRYSVPGLLNGSAIGLGLVFALLLGGYYNYWGIFIQSEETIIATITVIFRSLAVVVLVYCEEFLFRKKFIELLSRSFPPLWCAFLSAVAYCFLKSLQFDLGIMHLITIFLIAFRLGILSVSGWSFTRGAGYLAGLLLIFHPIMGMPIFGNDFSGIFYLKYAGIEGEVSGLLAQTIGQKTDSRTALFLTGGIVGPLSSFAFQAILIAQLALVFVREKKTIWIPRSSAIK